MERTGFGAIVAEGVEFQGGPTAHTGGVGDSGERGEQVPGFE